VKEISGRTLLRWSVGRAEGYKDAMKRETASKDTSKKANALDQIVPAYISEVMVCQVQGQQRV